MKLTKSKAVREHRKMWNWDGECNMKFIDICAGIGGFRLGFERAGHECIGYVEYDKFARTSYEAMYDTDGEWTAWDVTKLAPEEIPYADCWTFGFPCFPQGTKITTEKGLKNIEDIITGERVLTHENRLKKVLNTMSRKTNEIYTLTIQGAIDTKVTSEHPYLVYKDENTEWVKVKDLKKGDMVGFPVNTKSEIPQWGGVDYKRGKNTHTLNSLDLGSKDFWWVVGYYMADGWYRITKRKGATDNYRIVISGDDNKIERFKEKNNMFHATISKESTANKIHIVNKELTCYLMQFGKGAKNKHLTSDILNLPNDLLSAFLDGYFENDGCIIGNLRKASTVSKELALGIQACVHKVERKLCTIYHSIPPEFCTIESRVVHQNEVYDIRYPVINKKETKWFYKDNYIWTPVKSKIIINTDVEVYNFEVEGDNSYVANNIAVHNCQDISVAGKMKGIKNGTRSGIFYDIIKLLKGKSPKDRPKWLVIENVKNLLSIDAGGGYTEVLCEMAEAGYDAEWQVCNSKDFGVPQNRERVYIVGYLRERCAGGILPVTGTNSKIGLEILGKANPERHSDADVFGGGGVISTLSARDYEGPKMVGVKEVANLRPGKAWKSPQIGRVYGTDGLSPTIDTCQGGGKVVKIIDDTQGFDGIRIYENITPTLRAERCGLKILEAKKKGYAEAVPGDSIRRGRVQKQSAGTLETACNQGPLEKDGRIRCLTPREYYRLQGFPDNLFNKASSVNSKTQLYKQAGNAVTVNVAEAIGRKIAEVEYDN